MMWKVESPDGRNVKTNFKVTFKSSSSGEEGESGDRGEINVVGYQNRENEIAAHPEKRT
jgi:hypothetical protein